MKHVGRILTRVSVLSAARSSEDRWATDHFTNLNQHEGQHWGGFLFSLSKEHEVLGVRCVFEYVVRIIERSLAI